MTNEADPTLRTKPENNAWYLMATLYGDTFDLIERNRIACNRTMFPRIKIEDRNRLIHAEGQPLRRRH
jgi:hypothetical protein